MLYSIYAIGFLILLNQIHAHCPYIRRSIVLSDCIFDINNYLTLNTRILNANSIEFFGYYSLINTTKIFNQTLIYQFDQRWMLLIPFMIRCANQSNNLSFTECQYTIKRSQTNTEYMTTQMSMIDLEHLGKRSVLFLPAGEIILRSCKAYDCSKQHVYLTASNETFHFRINYEKTIGTQCDIDTDCNAHYSLSNLIYCDQSTHTCQCTNEHIHTMNWPNLGRLCLDSIEQSNCTYMPERCLHWCKQSSTSFCICPKSTRKVKKINGQYDCELESTDFCYLNEQIIGKCPTGTICDGIRCQPINIYRQLYENYPDEYFLSSSTLKPYQTSINFSRIILIVCLASLLFFILIILLILILIKTHRCQCLTSTIDEKISAANSTTEIYHLNTPYEQSFTGLIPQIYLSPRFYRQQHLSSLSNKNMFISV